MILEQAFNCPYCGETISTLVDLSEGDHHAIEDCSVCCRPIELLIETDGETLLRFAVGRDDESMF